MKIKMLACFLLITIFAAFYLFGCEGRRPFLNQEINLFDDDDDDDDLLNDDDSGDDDFLYPAYVRPDLPINAYYMASTHNTFIWRGPSAGPYTFVSSLGLIRALQFGQLFLEIDVQVVLDDGDFLVNHADTTQSVRLSGMLRNIRWWSDTHQDHEMVAVGLQWSVGSGDQNVADLNDLVQEFLIGPSPLTEVGPLYSKDDWIRDLAGELDQNTIDDLMALTPRDLALVLGYPSIREMRQKVVLETTSSVFYDTPSFFMLGGKDGNITNSSQESLDDVAAHTENRVNQRLSRIYPGGAFNTNFNLFDGFRYGVSNSAMNMEWVDEKSKVVFAFMDQSTRGYAPAGFVRTVDDAPTRLGPPVYVATFEAKTDGYVNFTLNFDSETGLENAPLALFRLVVQRLSKQEEMSIKISAPKGRLLYEREGNPWAAIFSLPADSAFAEINITVGGDDIGYEVHFTGPTLSGVEIQEDVFAANKMIWMSPTFYPINLFPTGHCAVLSKSGRVMGAYDGLLCDASPNPSFLIGMSGTE